MKLRYFLVLIGMYCPLAYVQQRVSTEPLPLYFCKGRTFYSNFTAFQVGPNFFLIPSAALKRFTALPLLLEKASADPDDSITLSLQEPAGILTSLETDITFVRCNLHFSISAQACRSFINDLIALYHPTGPTPLQETFSNKLQTVDSIKEAASSLHLASYVYFSLLQKVYAQGFAEKLQYNSLPENYATAQQLEACLKDPASLKTIITFFNLADRLNAYWLTKTPKLPRWKGHIKAKEPFTFIGWAPDSPELLFSTPTTWYTAPLEEWPINSTTLPLIRGGSFNKLPDRVIHTKKPSNPTQKQKIILQNTARAHYRTLVTSKSFPYTGAALTKDASYLAAYSLPNSITVWYLRNPKLYRECASNSLSLTAATLLAAFCKAHEKGEPWEITHFKNNASLFTALQRNQALWEEWLNKSSI